VQLKNLTAKNRELLLQNSFLSHEVEALRSERESLAKKQSELSPTLLPSHPPDEFSEFSFDIANWDEFVKVDNFALDWDQRMQMLSLTS
jgi:hypothetical protein